VGDLQRLLSPQTAAVIGGGIWGHSVIQQCQKLGFEGMLYAVHPNVKAVAGVPTYRSVADLPVVPDATFIAVNRDATIDIVRQLSKRGAGGAVCFASGFLEAEEENAEGAALQEALINAAGDMPIIGQIAMALSII